MGNSSGLIWPSSCSHSFDQSLNQPSSVDFDRHAPNASSDFVGERLGRRRQRVAVRVDLVLREVVAFDHLRRADLLRNLGREQLIREVLRDLTEASGRGDRVRRVLDRRAPSAYFVAAATDDLVLPSSQSLNRFWAFSLIALCSGRAVAEVQVRRELDVEILLELDVRLGELRRCRSSSERRLRRRRSCRDFFSNSFSAGLERRHRLARACASSRLTTVSLIFDSGPHCSGAT